MFKWCIAVLYREAVDRTDLHVSGRCPFLLHLFKGRSSAVDHKRLQLSSPDQLNGLLQREREREGEREGGRGR